MKTLSSTLIALAIAAPLFAAPAFAEAAPPAEDVSFKFTYDRADLQTKDGANKVLASLESQATMQCLPQGRTTLEDRRLARGCIATVMQNAIKQMNSQTVAEAYAARNS